MPPPSPPHDYRCVGRVILVGPAHLNLDAEILDEMGAVRQRGGPAGIYSYCHGVRRAGQSITRIMAFSASAWWWWCRWCLHI